MNDVVYVMVNSKLVEKKEGGRRSLEEFELDDRFMKNVKGGGDNENIDLIDTPTSNGDNKPLVEGQIQGGKEDDDALAISVLE